MKVELDMVAKTGISFEVLENNGAIFLMEKFPQIDELIEVEENVFRFITKEFVLNRLPDFTGHGAVELVQDADGSIHILNAVDHVVRNDNCSIEARAFNQGGRIHVNGRIGLEHRLLNMFTKPFVKPAFNRVMDQMIKELEHNLGNESFKNHVERLR